MDKKKISGDIPFQFLNELGHDTRAMERFLICHVRRRKR